MLKAATARGLGPCGPRHPLLRPRYRHAAAPASPPLSLLAGRTCHLPSHSAVITSGSPVYGTYGGSSPRLHALAARPLGGSLCKAHPRRAYLYPMARSHTYGKPHPSLVTTTGRATHLQTRAANGPDSSSSSGISERATSASTDASAVAAAQLLSGALDAALLPRLEAIEGRIVEAVEAKVVERLGEQGQRTKELVEAEVALLLPQIAILMRQELDATYALAPPQQQQQQAAQDQAGSLTTALISGVKDTWASVWSDPHIREALPYLSPALLGMYYVVMLAITVNLMFWILGL